MRARTRERSARRGAAMVELAIVLPLVLLLLFGLIIGSLGIFNYQQVATLAREGARYASVRGGQYARENSLAAANRDSIYNEAILPLTAGLDVNALSFTAADVVWDDHPTAPNKMPVYLANPATNTWRRNHVRVTVRYAWSPLMFFGPVTLQSTSVMPITY